MLKLDHILPKHYRCYDNSDEGTCAEESVLRWGFVTKSCVLVESPDSTLTIYAPSKRAAYIAKKQFSRKARRSGFPNSDPDKIIIGCVEEQGILRHADYRKYEEKLY